MYSRYQRLIDRQVHIRERYLEGVLDGSMDESTLTLDCIDFTPSQSSHPSFHLSRLPPHMFNTLVNQLLHSLDHKDESKREENEETGHRYANFHTVMNALMFLKL